MISHAWRWGAGVISAGAGLVSILSYTHSIKAKFDPDSVAVSGLAAVRWVGVTPALDTASSIGDTINLAVTATDPRGNALLGAPTLWSQQRLDRGLGGQRREPSWLGAREQPRSRSLSAGRWPPRTW